MNKQIPEIILNDGTRIPAIGFGTYALNGEAGVQSITSAIDVGYRLLDTAYNYENEGTVGEAVRRSSVPREELLITSKLPGRYQKYDKALTTIEESLYRANLDYYDLYLIHWPNPIQDHYVEAWQAMIEAQKRGYIRSIGVCNFLPEHLERLEKETGVKASLNQIELHPYFNQASQVAWHKENNIQTQSWSPLLRANELFQNPILETLAAHHNKSVAQIILRWHIQLGTIPIPKSASTERQRENIDVFDFELTDAQMQEISALTKVDGRNNDQDPAVYEEF